MRFLFLLATAFSVLLSTTASAAIHSRLEPRLELAVGGSFTNKHSDITTVLALAWLPPLRETDNGTLRAEVGALYLRGRSPDLRPFSRTDNTASVYLAHAGVRYEHHSGFVAGFGTGVQRGKTSALSGDPQFITSMGWRWGRASLLVRHISNNCLHEPNDGENILELAYRF